MSNLINQWFIVQENLLNHASQWKDRPDIMAFVLNFIVILIALVERLSDNGAIKHRIVDEIMGALEAYRETLKDD